MAPWLITFTDPAETNVVALEGRAITLHRGPFVDNNGDPLLDGDGSALFHTLGAQVKDADGEPLEYAGGEQKLYLGSEFVLEANDIPLTYEASDDRRVLALGGERQYKHQRRATV